MYTEIVELTYNQATIKADILLVKPASLPYHLVDEREDGKESYWLYETAIAEKKHLRSR